MKRFFRTRYFLLVLIALVAGVGAAFLGDQYVYWATSGYSQRSVIVSFPNRPSEEMLLEAMIYREPLIDKKAETIEQSKNPEGRLLFIKIDNNSSVVVSPYSADRDPNWGNVKGIWLTEPATRMHVPVPLVLTVYFLIGSTMGVFAVFSVIWLWYFLLSRLRELSQAIQGR